MKFDKLLADPFQQTSIAGAFQRQHERYLETFPYWSLQATRRKLVGSYWLKILLNHYVIVLVAGSLLMLTLSQQSIPIFLRGLFPTSILVFAILFICMYWPMFQLDFLPQLDSCIENYKGQQLEGIQQCKKEQYSVVSLMLIQYVLMDMAGLEMPLINTASAKLLAQQYGVSVKSIGPALKLVLRSEWDRKSIRKQTEITDDFETAKEYFRKLEEKRAIEILEKLQIKILR
jgi:hypothetical protein